MVYDITTINKYEDIYLFLLRFDVLKNNVDKFLVIDNLMTSKIPFLLSYINNIPYISSQTNIKTMPTHTIGGQCIFSYFPDISFKGNDIIITSDINDIPYPHCLNQIGSVEHDIYSGFFNTMKIPISKKIGSKICLYQDYNDKNDNIIQDSGWSFNVGDIDEKYITNNDIVKYIDDFKKFQKFLYPSDFFYKFIDGFFNFEILYNDIVTKLETGSHIVEVGSYYGASAIYLATKIKMSCKKIKLDCVDKWDYPSEKIYDDFIKNINNAFVGDIINPIKTLSTEASKIYNDNSLDFVFIDADHSYSAVKNDIKYWFPKIKEKCMIVGHDVWDDNVKQAYIDFVDENKNEIENNYIDKDLWYIYKK